MKKTVLIFAFIFIPSSSSAMELRFTLTECAAKMFEYIFEQTGATDPFSIHVKLDIQKQETVEEQLARMSIAPSLLSTKGEAIKVPCRVEYKDKQFPLGEDTLIINSANVSMAYVTIAFNPAAGFEELPLPATGMLMLNNDKRHIKIDYSQKQGFFYN